MTYLLYQHWLSLLIALVIGGIVGWMTFKRSNLSTSWWTGWVPAGTIIFVIGLIVALLKLLPGRVGLWLETALILFVAYIIGCFLGAFFRRGAKQVEAPAATIQPAVSKPEPVAAPLVAAPAPIPTPAPVVSAAAPAAELQGAKPVGLSAARGGKADDLKRIRGIGKQNEGRLHGLGIWHFDQIAAWTDEQCVWVGSYLAFPGRIEREEWVSQAKVLASGVETEFSKRVARGEVATSADDGFSGKGNIEKVAAKKAPSKPKK